MANPFYDPGGTYRVFASCERQYSLWPAFMEVPSGWDVRLARSTRPECVDYINAHWIGLPSQPDVGPLPADCVAESSGNS